MDCAADSSAFECAPSLLGPAVSGGLRGHSQRAGRCGLAAARPLSTSRTLRSRARAMMLRVQGCATAGRVARYRQACVARRSVHASRATAVPSVTHSKQKRHDFQHTLSSRPKTNTASPHALIHSHITALIPHSSTPPPLTLAQMAEWNFTLEGKRRRADPLPHHAVPTSTPSWEGGGRSAAHGLWPLWLRPAHTPRPPLLSPQLVRRGALDPPPSPRSVTAHLI